MTKSVEGLSPKARVLARRRLDPSHETSTNHVIIHNNDIVHQAEDLDMDLIPAVAQKTK
jgi:hypothetical protein